MNFSFHPEAREELNFSIDYYEVGKIENNIKLNLIDHFNLTAGNRFNLWF